MENLDIVIVLCLELICDSETSLEHLIRYTMENLDILV